MYQRDRLTDLLPSAEDECTEQVCARCDSLGEIPTAHGMDECPDCEGSGYVPALQSSGGV